MKVYLIRHGKTKGNEEKRYIGKTDESLSENGIAEIKQYRYPSADCIYVSPMKRCIETAEYIYPEKKIRVCRELRETDFGEFEGKNYEELKGNLKYQEWLDSNGQLPFPNGESREQFTKRCIEGFQKIISTYIKAEQEKTVALVVHGGTIMAIMEHFARPKKNYYDWQIKNAEMIVVEVFVEEQEIVLHAARGQNIF